MKKKKDDLNSITMQNNNFLFQRDFIIINKKSEQKYTTKIILIKTKM